MIKDTAMKYDYTIRMAKRNKNLIMLNAAKDEEKWDSDLFLVGM